MLEVHLVRAHVPEDVGQEEECGICGEEFVTETVLAKARTDHGTEVGLLCVICIDGLSSRWARLEEASCYEEMVLRNPTPIWPSIEEATRAWETGEDAALIAANTLTVGR